MRYRFGDCELDPELVELHVGGELRSVEPQVFDLLLLLVENRHRAVPKQELIETVWHDRFVTESSLTTRIKTIRRLVGDSGRAQHIIKTLHGLGYQFVAPVEELSDSSTTHPQPPASTVSVSTELDLALLHPKTDFLERIGKWPMVGRQNEFAAITEAATDPAARGVLLTGAIGLGTSRLATECVAAIRRNGQKVHVLRGNPLTKSVPLATFAHLLPPAITDVLVEETDTAETRVFTRAVNSLQPSPGADRLILRAENLNEFDGLSLAVMISLVNNGHAFVLATQAGGASIEAENDFVRSTSMRLIQLEPLLETHIDTLIYSALEGQIGVSSRSRLTELAEGNPGRLATILRTSLDSNLLTNDAGVWRLTRDPEATTNVLNHPEPAISDDLRKAFELLALAGSLPLDIASVLIGDDLLETLDSQRLITIDEALQPISVSLSSPTRAAGIRSNLGQLRSRRHCLLLAHAFEAQSAPSSFNAATAIYWQLRAGKSVAVDVVEAAGEYMTYRGEELVAEALVAHYESLVGETPRSLRRKAEISLRRLQIDQGQRQLEQVDLATLPTELRVSYVRRLAIVLFHHRGQHTTAMDFVDQHRQRLENRDRATLDAHWIAMAGYFGRATDVASAGPALTEQLSGDLLHEVQNAVAMTHVLQGRFTEAIALAKNLVSFYQARSGPMAAGSREVALATHVRALVGLGQPDQGLALARKSVPVGHRALWTVLPIAAAEAALAAGQTAQARELLHQPMATSTGLGLAPMSIAALLSQSAMAMNDMAAAEEHLRVVDTMLEASGGVTRFRAITAIAPILHQLGRTHEALSLLSGAIEQAAEFGAVVTEAELIARQIAIGNEPDALPRLANLVEQIEGTHWVECFDRLAATTGRPI